MTANVVLKLKRCGSLNLLLRRISQQLAMETSGMMTAILGLKVFLPETLAVSADFFPG